MIEDDGVQLERREPLADLRALRESLRHYQHDPAQLAEIVPR